MKDISTIMTKPNIHNLNRSQLSEKYFRNHFREYTQHIKRTYLDIEWRDALYIDQNNLSSVPLCPVCGKKLHLISLYKGYPTYCSPQCSGKGDKWDKFKSTMQSKYGCSHALQNNECKSKAIETSINRYGVDNYSKTSECRQRVKETCIQKYGEKYANLFTAKGIKVKRQKRLNNSEIPGQIGYTENGLWIMKCGKNCENCSDHTFSIRSGTYFDRMKIGMELCTKKYPVIASKIKDTFIERFIKDILDELNISYECNCRDLINPKEIDIYIPQKHIAVECNGIYWHSKKDQEYHILKHQECLKKNIQLLTIWEDWIRKKPEIVKSIIYSKLGIYKERIPARKCTIVQISANDFETFLNANHIQGGCKSPIRIGLIYENELVAVMSFCKKRGCIGKGKKDREYELTRFCSKLYTQIMGGADKMFKYFINTFYPISVFSFSSNDISTGKLYKKLGFEQKEATYNYWYIDEKNLRRYHRTSFTKHRIVQLGWKESVSKDWTEFQVTKEHGMLRIYDSGVIKWIYNLDSNAIKKQSG